MGSFKLGLVERTKKNMSIKRSSRRRKRKEKVKKSAMREVNNECDREQAGEEKLGWLCVPLSFLPKKKTWQLINPPHIHSKRPLCLQNLPHTRQQDGSNADQATS
jgi:hypothetical protein